MAAALDSAVCIGRLFQSKRAVHDGFHASLAEQRHHLRLDCGNHRSLVRVTTWAQRGTGMMQPLHHQLGEVDGGLGCAQECNLYDASIHGGRVVLLHSAPDGTVIEIVMTADEAREFVNGMGEAILRLTRTGVMA